MDRQIKHNLTGQPDYGWGMTDKPFLTIGEVADILQVSSRTVYNLIYKGTLRACRLTYHITIITKEDFFLMIRETTILGTALKLSNYLPPHCIEKSNTSVFIASPTAHSESR